MVNVPQSNCIDLGNSGAKDDITVTLTVPPFFCSESVSPAIQPTFDSPLPKWLRLYLPIAILVYPFLLTIPGWNWEEKVYREFGLIENLTVLFLALSVFLSAHAALLADNWQRRVLLLLFSMGCFVFLGEEVSWGQHFGNWTTPDEWRQLNRQNETNLHNLKGGLEFFFTTIVRNGICIGALVGSLLAPWWMRKMPPPSGPKCIRFWLWPAAQSAFVAILLNASVLPRKIARKILNTDLPVPYIGHDDGEMKEVLIALFFLLYALIQWNLSRNLRKLPAQPDAAA